MATTSSGPSRHLEARPRAALWSSSLIAAAATAAAAVLLLVSGDDTPPQALRHDRLAALNHFDERIPSKRTDSSIEATVPDAEEPATVASRITAEDLQRALSEVEPAKRDLVLESRLASFAQADARAAAHFADLQLDPYLREVALRVVAHQWARADPVAAADWAVSLADPAESDRAIVNVALELARSEPQRALTVLERRGSASTPDTPLDGVVQQWAMRDFDAALVWTETQPPGPGRDELLQHLIFLRAAADPEGAAQIANRTISDDTVRVEALASITPRWSARNPAAVREWAGALDARARRRVNAELALLDGG